MKKATFCIFAACMFIACGSPSSTSTASSDTTPATDNTAAAPVTYAYPIGYSSDFEIGDAKYAQTVLNLWKDFDGNNLDNAAPSFADSVRMDFADGSSFAGTRDSLIATAKKMRGASTSVTSSVDAITALKAKGKDETWVCIWGKEVHVAKGKTDSVYLQENWQFDSNGKIAYVSQFSQMPPKKK